MIMITSALSSQDGVTHRIYIGSAMDSRITYDGIAFSYWEACSLPEDMPWSEPEFVRRYGYGPRREDRITCLACLGHDYYE